MADTDDINRQGVGIATVLLTRHVGIFREQETSDYGVDGHVEFRDVNKQPTGRLVGVQLKSGSSAFDEPSEDGWIFRPEKRHIGYWLGHSLPMYILLVNVDNDTIYWQEFSERTLKRGKRGGTYIEVPKTQTLDNAREPWLAAADEFARLAGADYDENLSHLAPETAKAIRKFAETHTASAQLLAAHLARSRATPQVVIRTLLDSQPAWLLVGSEGHGLGVIAQYAIAHGLPELAVETLAGVIAVDTQNRYKHTRTCGLLLLGHDHERARAYLDEAKAMSERADDVRLAIGYAVLAHPVTSADPVTVSPELQARLEAAAGDDVAVAFLARQAEFGGDHDASVHLHEAALALEPDSAAYMQRLAHALLRRAHSVHAHTDDAVRAVDIATKALEQLHTWGGPTGDALDTLLQAQLSAGRVSAVLDTALPPPHGMASLDEAHRPRVQAVTALAASMLGRDDVVDAILQDMPGGLDRDIARLRVQRGLNEADARTAWQDVVGRLNVDRPQDLLTAVLHLADLGVDESNRLDVLVERGMITASMRAVAAAIAAAVQDLDRSLPSLRVLAESEEAAATKLVELLLSAERFVDAEVAADAAMTRFSGEHLSLMRIDALDGQGRIDDAEVALTNVLSMPTLDPFNRRLTHRRLVQIAYRRLDEASDAATRTQLLQTAERHATACVDQLHLQVDDRDVWRLADVRYRLGRPESAYKVIADGDPAFTHRDHARLWLILARQQTRLPVSAYARMLDLADQFADDAELSAQLLTTVTTMTRDAGDEPASPQDPRVVLPGELRAAAFDALQAHVARFGDDTPVKFLSAPTTEGLVEKMTDMLRRDDAPLIEMLEMVRQARLPSGVFSSAIGKPYASTLAERPLGYYLAAPAIDDDDDSDVAAASASSNTDVVVDASALLVSTELGEYDQLRGMFRTVLIPIASTDDIMRSRTDLDGRSASAGYVTYNSAADTIVAYELDVDEHLDALDRFIGLERAATSPQRIADVSLGELTDIDMRGAAAWLAPIALAKERRVALWSDDLGQRRLARATGVPAFATTTLQHLRTIEQLDRAENDSDVEEVVANKRAETLMQIDKHIVDIPVDTEFVIEAGQHAEWHERIALVTIGRPGWWHMTANPFKELQLILRAVPTRDDLQDRWRYHAMWGVVRLAFEEPSRGATLLAAVALTPIGDELDAEAAARHLTAAQEIASHRKTHKPSDYLAEAATTLAEAEVLADAAQAVTKLRTLMQTNNPVSDTAQAESNVEPHPEAEEPDTGEQSDGDTEL